MTATVHALDANLDARYPTPLDLAIDNAEALARYRPTDNRGRTLKALNAIQLDSYIRAAAKACHPCGSS